MRLGLIVNPVAGLGGRVGLKGTDRPEVVRRARRLGAVPEAPGRAQRALNALSPLRDQLLVLTYPGEMGEKMAQACGFRVELVGRLRGEESTAEDTQDAAQELLRRGVDLLLFCGGDGTARDIYAAVGTELVVVGIPAGVKMHSAVFAPTPERAGEVARRYLEGEIRAVVEAEVMDIDEKAFRRGEVHARLFGYLKAPRVRGGLQGAKVATPPSERYVQQAIAARVVEDMKPGVLYLIGPGTTTKAVLEALGLTGTLLGVDAIRDGKLQGADLSEGEILSFLNEGPAKAVVSPIGGQGHILGRGNQQLSPRVIRAAGGKRALVVLATPEKLATLRGRPLMVDTGDPALDEELSGYIAVITGYRERVIYRVTH